MIKILRESKKITHGIEYNIGNCPNGVEDKSIKENSISL